MPGPERQVRHGVASDEVRIQGALKGNVVSGSYINPLGGTGEYFTAKLTYAAATKSFAGKLSFVGRCKGTSAVKAKKA